MIDTFLMVVFNFARSGVSLNLPLELPLDEAKLFSSFRPFGPFGRIKCCKTCQFSSKVCSNHCRTWHFFELQDVIKVLGKFCLTLCLERRSGLCWEKTISLSKIRLECFLLREIHLLAGRLMNLRWVTGKLRVIKINGHAEKARPTSV